MCIRDRLAGGGVFLLFVGEVEGQARVDDSLTAEDIFIVAAGDVDVGKDLIVRVYAVNLRLTLLSQKPS